MRKARTFSCEGLLSDDPGEESKGEGFPENAYNADPYRSKGR